MAKHIVHGYLDHGKGQLIEAGGHSEGRDSFDTVRSGNEIFKLQLHGFIPGQIEEDQTGGEYLAGHRCPCSSGNTPAEGKNEQGVQHSIDQSAGDHGYHGIGRTAVRPDQMVAACCQHKKRNAPGGDPHIGHGIGQNLGGSAEGQDQRLQEQADQNDQDEAAQDEAAESCACNMLCLFFMFTPKFQIKIGGASDSYEESDSCSYGGNGKSHVCRGISVHAHALPDEDLVHDIIQRVDQHADDSRYREFGQ